MFTTQYLSLACARVTGAGPWTIEASASTLQIIDCLFQCGGLEPLLACKLGHIRQRLEALQERYVALEALQDRSVALQEATGSGEAESPPFDDIGPRSWI